MIKTRIIQLIEYKGFVKEEFFSGIGMTSANFRGKAKDSPLNSTAIENIFAEVPDVNLEWLLTGSGNMLTNEACYIKPDNTFNLYTDSNIDVQEVPLYDLSATAGLLSLFCDKANQVPIDMIKIPNVPKCDGAIYVTDDSMYPLLKSGDIILYKQINDIKNYIIWGDIYIISFEFDEDEFIAVKFINKSDEPNSIKLVSHNIHHAPMDIHISSVRAMAIVKASIRFNTIR